MTKMEEAPTWRDVLDRCGLQVLDEGASNGPPVLSAIYAVNGIEVKPIATVPLSSPGATIDLDAKWHFHAARISLYSESGEFLILPPVPKGHEIGWVRVRDTVGKSLPSRIAETTGKKEFITVSIDGRRLCATSKEDDDYWVVVHEFPRQETEG
ncbi:hypothetical protein AB0N50_16275 [Streptomyces pharetrae]|jgi:hypothetical protein|uniref:hypothetical protein n=1 Tax=Streptomyces pharetrae TaxID=291370 RepID=UPI00345FBBC8